MALSFSKTLSGGVGLPGNPVPAGGGVVTWVIQLADTGNNDGPTPKNIDLTITDLVASISPAVVTSFTWTADGIPSQAPVPGPAAGSGDINFQWTGPKGVDNGGNWGVRIFITATIGPSVGPSNALPGLQLSQNTATVNVLDDGKGGTFQDSADGFVYQRVLIETGEVCCGLTVHEGDEHFEYGYRNGYGQRFHTCQPFGVNDGWQPLGA